MGLYDRDYGREQTPYEKAESRRYGGGFGGGGGGTFGGLSGGMSMRLIIVTSVIWLVSIILGEFGGGSRDGENWILDWFALRGDTLYKPWMWWQWISYGFLHAPLNIMHLFGNMLGLFFFGRTLEQKYGAIEFLRFYLVSMIVAGIAGSAFYLFRGEPNSITIGASGAVAAVVMVFVMNERNANILLFFVLPVPAWLFGLGFVLYNISGAIQQIGGSSVSDTAFMVHVGGIAMGLAYYHFKWNFSFLAIDGIQQAPTRLKRNFRRTKLKVHDPDRKLQQNADEADRILDKIHKHGEQSLTSAERKVLQRYSKNQRSKRNNS